MFITGIPRNFVNAGWRCLHHESGQILTKGKLRPKTSGIIAGVRYLGGVNMWHEELSRDIRKQIEAHWSNKIVHEPFDENSDKEKFYVLSMFPYPSGSLHLGHVRVYSLSDVLARYYRMSGKNVIHPMGWDSFGLPAENAAIERNECPENWTQNNIANMKSLMEEMNFSFDWNREFATCDSDYYKWTQFLFLKMYESGLVYRKEAFVNWDPVDETVLADEQVDSEGRSWRSGAIVEKKLLKQWFIRTTAFSKSLDEGLTDPCMKNWADIVNIQKHWIGEVNGTTIDFEIVDQVPGSQKRKLPIWLKCPEYIDRAKFVAVKPKSFWAFGCTIEGLLPYRAKNPFTNELLPVYLTNSVEFPEGADAHLGIPDLSKVDKAYACSLKIPDSPGLQNSATKEELMMLREKICAEARERNIGGYPTSSKLKDWLISRQRYWGTPIPIIYCESCGEQPVPDHDLPVRLPEIKSMEKGKNPLANEKDWLNTSCPKCGKQAVRETDTMDTFVDSSWYYLRFLDPDNNRAAFGVEKVKKLLPVDVYIGGKEHATLHLFYARFMNHFLNSVGLVPVREPFKRLLCQGMVRGKTYKLNKTGEYVKPSLVEEKNGKFFHKDTKELINMEWEKMSKSKHNGIEPRFLLAEYGSDTTRLVILSETSPYSNLDWNEKSFGDIIAWQHRLWLTVSNFIKLRSKNAVKPEETEEYQKLDYFIYDSRNFYLNKITQMIEKFLNVSAAISKMQGLTKSLRKCNEDVIIHSVNYEKALALQIISLGPVAPCFASELWAGFVKAPNKLCHTGEILWDKSLFYQPWPQVDKDYEERSSKVVGMLNIRPPKGKKEKKLEKKLKKLAAEGGANTDDSSKKRKRMN